MTTRQALSALTVSVKNDSLTNKMLFEMSILTHRHSLVANVGILQNKKKSVSLNRVQLLSLKGSHNNNKLLKQQNHNITNLH